MNDVPPAGRAGPDDVGPGQGETRVGRRDFIGSMAADALTLAATVAGAASALRAASAGTAAALVAAPAPRPPAGGVPDATGSATADDAAGAAGGGPAGDPEAGFRPAFRLEGDALVLLDQRRLPDEVVEVRCRTADDVALAMRDLVVRGAPALGQVAAYGLALAAGRAADSPPWARGAMVAGAAATLRAARPTAVNVGWALDRLLARLAAEEQRQSDGPAIASALRTEADAVAAAATEDHLRMAGLGVGLLPWFADRPTRILTHCNTGPLACGRIGTALGVVQVAHADGRRVHVFVDETRPWLQGARLTAWELARAGVPCRILADAAAGWLLASGVVDAVLVGADRIAANGDTANKIGTYPLAALADRHGVPFYVVAPTASIDLDAPDGAAIPIETRAADEVLSIRGLRIAPAGVEALNPVFDVTPAELVTAIVTEAGVLRAPFGVALATAVGARAGKRPAVSPPIGPAGTPGAAHAAATEP